MIPSSRAADAEVRRVHGGAESARGKPGTLLPRVRQVLVHVDRARVPPLAELLLGRALDEAAEPEDLALDDQVGHAADLVVTDGLDADRALLAHLVGERARREL